MSKLEDFKIGTPVSAAVEGWGYVFGIVDEIVDEPLGHRIVFTITEGSHKGSRGSVLLYEEQDEYTFIRAL